MSLALVSIIIPVFNNADTLAKTILSAVYQTWPNKEIIIIDDGSEDDSFAIAIRFENEQIKVLHQENKGASAARNYGLREAKGDYIQFLDADDLLDPKKIEEQLAVLHHQHDTIACGFCIHFFGADGNYKHFKQTHPHINPTESSFEFIQKLYGFYPHIPASMMEVHTWLSPRNIIEKAGFWNEELSVDDDGEYFLRVMLSASQILYVKSAISYYRKKRTPNSLSAQIGQKKGFLSALKALDLKVMLLEPHFSKTAIETIFGKFYWEKASLAYPRFKIEYRYCAFKAREFRYKGPKFNGGPNASKLAKLLGWKTVKQLQHMKTRIYKYLKACKKDL